MFVHMINACRIYARIGPDFPQIGHIWVLCQNGQKIGLYNLKLSLFGANLAQLRRKFDIPVTQYLLTVDNDRNYLLKLLVKCWLIYDIITTMIFLTVKINSLSI